MNKVFPTPIISLFFFDAFSGKSTPELWTPEFLALFLQRVAQEKAVFATYACTGTLKRTLQTAGFVVEKRPGFQGKRDSTTAVLGALPPTV
jgi:tRNA U34 5-methylaminomethyl-2-thiouridine-forming methyltransferase MnmC